MEAVENITNGLSIVGRRSASRVAKHNLTSIETLPMLHPPPHLGQPTRMSDRLLTSLGGLTPHARQFSLGGRRGFDVELNNLEEVNRRSTPAYTS